MSTRVLKIRISLSRAGCHIANSITWRLWRISNQLKLASLRIPFRLWVYTQTGLMRFALVTHEDLYRVSSYFTKEPLTLRFIDLLRSGDVVIDVGASMGIYSVHMAKRVAATGLVMSVEPDSEKVMRLRMNTKLNRVAKSLVVIPKAASDNSTPSGTTITVAQLLSEVTVTGRVFVKIDTDGADLEAVKGIGSCFESERRRPLLIQIESRINDAEVAEFLRSRGYELAIHDWHKLRDEEFLNAQPVGMSWGISRK